MIKEDGLMTSARSDTVIVSSDGELEMLVNDGAEPLSQLEKELPDEVRKQDTATVAMVGSIMEPLAPELLVPHAAASWIAAAPAQPVSDEQLLEEAEHELQKNVSKMFPCESVIVHENVPKFDLMHELKQLKRFESSPSGTLNYIHEDDCLEEEDSQV